MERKNLISIAIDGPAGSGKSTIAKIIAKELDYIYIDTGAMYRTVGFYCINNGIDYNNETMVSDAMSRIDIAVNASSGEQRIFLNGTDVTEAIRTQEVAASASAVARYGIVREALTEIQRGLAKKNNVVMDGRDIGTNVLPNSQIKIYMDAKPEERAKRRYSELEQKGISYEFETVLKEIIARDDNDKNREISPLKKAEDAFVLDTDNKNIQQVSELALNYINKRLGEI